MSELGVDIKELIKHVTWIRSKSSTERQNILEQADKQIPRDIGLKATKLIQELCYDRRFCEQAGLDYANIQQEDSRLIKVALADYLIRKMQN